MKRKQAPGFTPPVPKRVRSERQVKTEDQLRGEIEAYRTLLGYRAPRLLIDLAEALLFAEEACTIAVPAASLDGSARLKPESREPFGGHKGAIAAQRGLETKVGQAVRTFWSRKADDWSRPTAVAESAEKVRCRNRRCDRVDRWAPRSVRVGGSTIDLSFCPSCGGKLAS